MATLKEMIRKNMASQAPNTTVTVNTEQQVAALRSVLDMVDLGSPDMEFCSLDHVVEQSDLSMNPELLAMLKERSQGGPLALCQDAV